MNKLLCVFPLFFFVTFISFGQKEKVQRYFDNPIIADSALTLMIPVRYNAELLSANKIALFNDYYANIIFYDIISDTSKKLFVNDTYIQGFSNNYSYRYEMPKSPKNISRKWIFYFVREVDSDKNGRIDSEDPAVLYVSDKNGNDLKAITQPDENAVSIEVFDVQDFALVKMQRDKNKDKSFNSKDKDYYYIRLNLETLTFGNKIEISEVQ